jgi:hypothetical protein
VSVIHIDHAIRPVATPVTALLLNGWACAIGEAAAAADWLRRTRCALGGHAMMLRFEPGRLSLRCQSCGAQTPGWVIGN